MRVTFLWHCTYPWDIRIYKMIRSCMKCGFTVDIICKGKEGYPRRENTNDFSIYRVGKHDTKLGKILSYPLFFNRIWWNDCSEILSSRLPSLLIVRDIPLAMTAIWLGRKFNIPVILDMAENYPAALISYKNPHYKPFLIFNAVLPRCYEQVVVNRIDHIAVVAEEQIKRLGNVGVPERKISVIRNTPDSSFFNNGKLSNGELPVSFKQVSPIILYVGKLDPHRGVDILIQSLPMIQKAYPNAGLLLIGDGKFRQQLECQVKELRLKNHVFFTGWVDHTLLPAYIKMSTLCCIPHYKSEHTDTTIPNKLFDYMGFGKPVVSSNLSPVSRIIKATGSGVCYEDKNYKALAQSVIRTLENNEIEKMSNNGMEWVKKTYNWETDGHNFLTMLEKYRK